MESYAAYDVRDSLDYNEDGNAPKALVIEPQAIQIKLPYLILCNMQEPRVLFSGLKTSPTIVYGMDPTPAPYKIVADSNDKIKPTIM